MHVLYDGLVYGIIMYNIVCQIGYELTFCIRQYDSFVMFKFLINQSISIRTTFQNYDGGIGQCEGLESHGKNYGTLYKFCENEV